MCVDIGHQLDNVKIAEARHGATLGSCLSGVVVELVRKAPFGYSKGL